MAPSLFNSFAHETGIFGLHLFREKRGLFDIIFWGAFVAVFGCYTVKSIVVLCEQYLAEETITKVTQERIPILVFPAPQFCMVGSPLGDLPADPHIEAILNQYTKTGDLNVSNFVSSLSFLQKVATSELLLLPGTGSSEAFSSRLNASGLILALSAFSNLSFSTFLNFSNFVLQKFCRGLNLSLTFNDATSGMTETDLARCQEMTPFFTPTNFFAALCVNFDGVKFPFKSRSDLLTLSYNSTAVSTAIGLSLDILWLDLDSLYYFVESGDADFDAGFAIDSSRRRSHNVKMSAQYTNLQLRREPCVEDRKQSKLCHGLCMASYFFQSFGCSPMFRIFGLSSPGESLTDFRHCEAEDYLKSPLISSTNQNLSLGNSTNQAYDECRARCLPPCVKPVFAISAESWSPSDMSVVMVRVLSHVYMSIEEELAKDFEGLLSDFGGALGLWLGASFAAVVHIPIFALQAIADWLMRKKKTESPSLEMTPPASGAPTDIEVLYEGLERRFHDEMEAMEARLDAVEQSLSEGHL